MRCDRCSDGARGTVEYPDVDCWDRRASSDQIDLWVGRFLADHRDNAKQYLGQIGDASAAPTLRNYLGTDDPQLLVLIVRSLGWSGDSSDGAAVTTLLDHPAQDVRVGALSALVELRIPGTADLLADGLSAADPLFERRLRGLAWLDDPRAAPVLRDLYESEGPQITVDRTSVVTLLMKVGDRADRERLARDAGAVLEKSGADGYAQRKSYNSVQLWFTYEHAAQTYAPLEFAATWAGLSAAAQDVIGWYRRVAPEQTAENYPPNTRMVPRLAFRELRETADASSAVPSKFFGQPDWIDTPAWPIGTDGVPLMFYGQLAVGERIAYLFTGGPDEWDVLGGGTAVVTQPGNLCHLPCEPTSIGPQLFERSDYSDHFVNRGRHTPVKSRYLTFEPGKEPAEWPANFESAADDTATWNKIGGTPRWLQGDETPSGDWTFAFQFGASEAGAERGDGAEFYAWVNPEGMFALGWQCH